MEAAGENREEGPAKGGVPHPPLGPMSQPLGSQARAHLALQVDGWVAVGEVLPEQQRVFVLLPRQAVTVVIKVKSLPSKGATREGMAEQGPGRERDRGLPQWVCSYQAALQKDRVAADGQASSMELNPFDMQKAFPYSLYNLKCMFLRCQALKSMEMKGIFPPKSNP